MLTKVVGSMPSFITSWIICLVKRAAVAKSSPPPSALSETAIEGHFITTASAAADTVPEYNTSVPRLGPWFIPETTRSISSSTRRAKANFTQSTGVPPTIQAFFTPGKLVGTALIGSNTVIE